MIAIVMAAAAGAVYMPSGKWVMDYQPGLCLLTRTYAAGDARISFGFRQSPGDHVVEIVVLDQDDPDDVTRREIAFLRPGTADTRPAVSSKPILLPGGRRRALQIVDGPPQSAGPAVSVRVPGSRQRLMRALFPRTALDALTAQDTLTVEQLGRRVHVVSTAGLGKALAALGTCEAEQIRSWGVDPDRVATPAEPVGDMTGWFAVPGAARTRPGIGDTTIRWTITAAGAAENCMVVRSSNNAPLDQAACAQLIRNARYRPARDHAGQPVASLQTRRIIWSIG